MIEIAPSESAGPIVGPSATAATAAAAIPAPATYCVCVAGLRNAARIATRRIRDGAGRRRGSARGRQPGARDRCCRSTRERACPGSSARTPRSLPSAPRGARGSSGCTGGKRPTAGPSRHRMPADVRPGSARSPRCFRALRCRTGRSNTYAPLYAVGRPRRKSRTVRSLTRLELRTTSVEFACEDKPAPWYNSAMILILGMAALLQQGVYQGATSPPSGDTVGYWQQRVRYTVVATLDEAQTKLRGRGNARVRQQLAGHAARDVRPPVSERVSSGLEMERGRRARESRALSESRASPTTGTSDSPTPPVVDGTPVFVDYPGAPDSTVAHFKLAGAARAARLGAHRLRVGRAPVDGDATPGASRPHVRLCAVVSEGRGLRSRRLGAESARSGRRAVRRIRDVRRDDGRDATIRCSRRPAFR